ncbi:ribonuclease P protein component [Methylocella sp.]|uniref:ribonuclease P protein component n=1 Tax=Methylocella sp. TaxID=1978226 RepID=UPI0035AE8913
MTASPAPGSPRPSAPARLKKRADFLRAAKGGRQHARAFTLQAADRDETDTPPRFGLTVTKKTGGAVKRNRIRRRLREALRLGAPLPARPGRDYVIIARIEALTQSFPSLQADLARAIGRIAGEGRADEKRPRKGAPRR